MQVAQCAAAVTEKTSNPTSVARAHAVTQCVPLLGMLPFRLLEMCIHVYVLIQHAKGCIAAGMQTITTA